MTKTAKQNVPALYYDYVFVGFGRLVPTFWSSLPASTYLPMCTASDPKKTVILALTTARTSHLTRLLLFWISHDCF
jgi:hypothetical protein